MTFEQELHHKFRSLLKIRVFFSILSKDFPIVMAIFPIQLVVILMMNFAILERYFPIAYSIFFTSSNCNFWPYQIFQGKKNRLQMSAHLKYIACSKTQLSIVFSSHALPTAFGHLITVPSRAHKLYSQLYFWKNSFLNLNQCKSQIW